MGINWRCLSVGLVLAVGCGTDGSTEQADAGGTVFDAGGAAPEVEVGVGETEFKSVVAGQSLQLVQAPQQGGAIGFGFHFDVAARAKGLNPKQAEVTFTVTRVRDGERLSTVTRKVDLLADDGGSYVVYGVRAVVDQCADVVEESLDLRVDVQDVDGRQASDQRPVSGPDFCSRG